MSKTLLNYIDEINNIETKVKLKASIEMLKHVDNMNDYLKTLKTDDTSAILVHAFGLLQGLFVGVDSLYNLVLSITKYKYFININQNPIIRGLKYIRNDIVGHPTDRKYASGGVGYSTINLDLLNNDELTYKTIHFRRGKLKEKQRKINFDDLILAYNGEKEIIYDQLESYINKDYTNVHFSEKLIDFHLNINQQNINNIRKEFIKEYGNYKQHRFLWRLDQLQMALYWEEDNRTVQELINYIRLYLAVKLEQISFDLENEKADDVKLKAPIALINFSKEINKRKGLRYFTNSLNDINHPFFDSDLDFLIEKINDNKAKELLIYLQSLKDNVKVFLIGSVLKKYNI